jgi:hypothetical protein
MRFQLNGRQVVSEVLDGEVIAIHLQSGTYYSMIGSSASVWNAMQDGWSKAEIIDRLTRDTGFERRCIDEDISHFVAALLAEELILPGDGEGSRSADLLPSGAYAKPELHKYTDMQELLLVDPIHEVTEEGWPSRATLQE